MQAYFTTGGLDKIAIGAQQAVVRALIDSDLDQTVKYKLDATVPIFPDNRNPEEDSMMKLIEEQIMIRHPLAVRRRDFLKHALKPGQSRSAVENPTQAARERSRPGEINHGRSVLSHLRERAQRRARQVTSS